MNTDAARSVASVSIGAQPASPPVSVAVLGGGASGERDVSLTTARCVAAALRQSNRVVEVEVEASGAWRMGGRSLQPERALSELPDIDVFFIGLHGGAGEDGTLQGFLETAGRCFTGSGVRSSALCMDKLATRGLATAVGITVAPGVCIRAEAWRERRTQELERAAASSRDGWVVKPRCGGSSVNTAIVATFEQLDDAIERVIASGEEALVEGRVLGVELSCGVLEDSNGVGRALTPIEIHPAEGRFFDYEQKYSSGGALEVCPPRSADAAMQLRVRELTERIHRAAGCRGYSRSDFMLPREGAAWGEPRLLEVNTLPGMTERSLLPQEAAVDGVGYDQLCQRIVASAVRARGLRR